jgi:transcriptional regulator with XRE-family HTH domain
MQKSIHTPEYAVLCSALRTEREKAGISQRDLAARLKVHHSWVAKVETGERRIDLVEFCWYVAACGGDSLEVSQRLLRKIAPQPAKPSKGARSK